MIIRVDYYKPSGKWYAGGDVDVGPARLWKESFRKAIQNNQQILQKDNLEFFCVTSNARPSTGASEAEVFAMALFKPGVLD